jgi:protein ImuB
MIPSYDDLTPGIPDEVDAQSASQLTLFLRNDLNRRPGDQEPLPKKDSPDLLSSCSPPLLFACLRRTVHPELQTAHGELPAFAEAPARQALLALARDFSPRVMVASEREVLLDVSGLGRLIGAPPAIAAALARAVYGAGLEASVALAPTQTAARVLATQSPDCPMTRWPYLPVRLLQPLETVPPGMNHRDRARLYETLDRWGIVTLGDLAALPAAALSSRLGRRGVALQRLARGLDPRPFVPDGDTPRYIGRLELEWPLDTLEPLSFVFARLLEPLSAALERADRGAAAIRVELRLTTRDTHARVLQLPAPMRDPKVLRTLLLLDLEARPPSAAVDVVSIELDPAPARITQFSLLERAVPSPETLSTLTARLSALVGEARVGAAALLDSHRPDAFAMTRFAPESPGAKGADGTHGANGAGAEGANGAVLRRQRVPPAIRVSVEHGRPVRIAVSKPTMPQGAVLQAAGPWRTSGGWWAHPPQGGSHESCPWSRDEWDVALTSGTVCRIFQDRSTERWFLDGIYD